MPGTRLRNDHAFRRFWSAHAISTTGSTVTTVVLPILMFQRTGSALLTSLLDTVYLAPYVLLGLFAGALADREDRRRVMIASELACGVALGSIPLASAVGVLSNAQIFIAAAMAGICFVSFDSAQFGALPALFGRSRLIMAMTALGSVDNALYVAGPGLGGLLATTIGPASAISIDAASCLVSGLLIATVHGRFGPDRVKASGNAWPLLRADIAEGVRYLWGHRVIRALTLAGTLGGLTSGAVVGLLVCSRCANSGSIPMTPASGCSSVPAPRAPSSPPP